MESTHIASLYREPADRYAGGSTAYFHRTLAEACRAEIPLGPALETLARETPDRKLRRAIQAMSRDLNQGVPLYEAYARQFPSFPAFQAELLKAGAAAGDIAGALDEIAEYAATQEDTRSQLRSALLYPLVTALIILCLGTFVLLAGTSDLWYLVETMTDETPWLLSGVAIGILVVFIAVVLVTAWGRAPLSRGSLGGVVFFRGLRLQLARASLTSTLHLLLRRGMPLHEALELAGESCAMPAIADRVRSMAKLAAEGSSLGESVHAGGVLEPSLMWLVESAEGSASAADALGDVAAIYRRRLLRRIQRLNVVVRPTAELTIGAAVFLFAYSFVLPSLELMNQLAAR